MTPAALTPGALDEIEALYKKVTRPGDVWQYGVAGAAGIVAYDMQDVRCQIPIAGASGDGYGRAAYGASLAADLAIAAVNALPALIASARELEQMRGAFDATDAGEFWRDFVTVEKERDAALADLAKAREELERLRKTAAVCDEVSQVQRLDLSAKLRDAVTQRDEARARFLALETEYEAALSQIALEQERATALEARAADALLAEAVIDDDVASEAQMMARLTWHDRVRRYLSNAPAAPAKATFTTGAICARCGRADWQHVDEQDCPALFSPLAAQLAEAVDLLRGMEGRLPLSHPGRPRLDAFFAAIDAGRARAT